jgi:hypothetical protein
MSLPLSDEGASPGVVSSATIARVYASTVGPTDPVGTAAPAVRDKAITTEIRPQIGPRSRHQ